MISLHSSSAQLFLFRSAQRDVDVVFVLQVRVGSAGLRGFLVAFAGELEGADGFFFEQNGGKSVNCELVKPFAFLRTGVIGEF